jgi:phosphohistidine phosphatase
VNLYLMRHGEARPSEEAPARPLSQKGRLEVQRMGAFVRDLADVRVGKIVHSKKLRARETAEILAEFLRPTGGVYESDGLEPLADVTAWADRLSGEVGDVLLVGHLPHVGRLAGYLLGGGEDDEPIAFQPGGIACLFRNYDSETWSIRWVIYPGMVPSGH